MVEEAPPGNAGEETLGTQGHIALIPFVQNAKQPRLDCWDGGGDGGYLGGALGGVAEGSAGASGSFRWLPEASSHIVRLGVGHQMCSHLEIYCAENL